jgi:ribosomal protein L6P/L9E
MRNYCLSNFYKLYINKVKQLLQSFSQVFFIKLKFKGKGYYIYKSSRNTITTQFGHAHRIYIYSFFISVKFLSKTSVFLFGTSKNDLLKIGYTIQKARPINIFTGRGVRFTRQIIYRKTGKISTHK